MIAKVLCSTKVKTGRILDRFFGGDKIISEYFESKFLLCFCWHIQCQSSFFKKMKSFLVKGFYLKFVEKVKCILKLSFLYSSV